MTSSWAPWFARHSVWSMRNPVRAGRSAQHHSWRRDFVPHCVKCTGSEHSCRRTNREQAEGCNVSRKAAVLTGSTHIAPKKRTLHRFSLLQGVLPISPSDVPGAILAGVTLAALAIPEVMGYTRIAGTPVVTGLYTLLLPMTLFALFGSSRHLVVGADSATAAILAGGLAGMATPKSPEWVGLSSVVALIVGALLLIARVARLGFLADFLSRTVLVGFLTGVGIQVALGEVPGLLGLPSHGGSTLDRVIYSVADLRDSRWPVMAIAAAVIAMTIGFRFISRRIPGTLLAVIGALGASWYFNLQAHGIPVIGAVPSGAPSFGLPHVAWNIRLFRQLFPTAIASTVVILAQSAATSRAYAARYGEEFDENHDLVGLGLANFGAAVSGTFLVNGSPTKTEMVTNAGGRSQLSQLVTSVLVLLVLLFITRPLSYMPQVVLSAVVFVIGIDLISIGALRDILAVRPVEFAIALITAGFVVFVGVEQGILAAMALSLFAHVRHGYHPHNNVLVQGKTGPRTAPVSSNGEIRDGIIVYRFNHSMYYANAAQLSREVSTLLAHAEGRLRWFCFDMTAVDDIDYSAAQTLRSLIAAMKRQHVRPVFVQVMHDVNQDLQRYGILRLAGSRPVYTEIGDVIRAYEDEKNQARTDNTAH